MQKKLYSDLNSNGLSAWIDCEDLLPGQRWKDTINNTIEECDYFIALLSSNSLTKKGYVNKELKIALDKLDELSSPLDIYMIPVRIDDCQPNDLRLKYIHYVDLFPSYQEGFNKILKAIKSKNDDENKNTLINNVDETEKDSRAITDILSENDLKEQKTFFSQDDNKNEDVFIVNEKNESNQDYSQKHISKIEKIDNNDLPYKIESLEFNEKGFPIYFKKGGKKIEIEESKDYDIYWKIKIEGKYSLLDKETNTLNKFCGEYEFEDIKNYEKHLGLKFNGKYKLWNKQRCRYEQFNGIENFESIEPDIRDSNEDNKKKRMEITLGSKGEKGILTNEKYWILKINGKWKVWNKIDNKFEQFNGIEEFEYINMVGYPFSTECWILKTNGKYKLWNSKENKFERLGNVEEFDENFGNYKILFSDYLKLKVNGKYRLLNKEKDKFEQFGGVEEFDEIEDNIWSMFSNNIKIKINEKWRTFEKKTKNEIE